VAVATSKQQERQAASGRGALEARCIDQGSEGASSSGSGFFGYKLQATTTDYRRQEQLLIAKNLLFIEHLYAGMVTPVASGNRGSRRLKGPGSKIQKFRGHGA
jgi:hypothetical protein